MLRMNQTLNSKMAVAYEVKTKKLNDRQVREQIKANLEMEARKNSRFIREQQRQL